MAASLSSYIGTHRPFPWCTNARPSIYHRRHQELPWRRLPFPSTARSLVVMTSTDHVVVPSQRATGPVERIESAKFQNTLWGDHFLTAKANSTTNDRQGRLALEVEWREYEAAKEEVRRMVTADEVTTGAVSNDNYVAIAKKLRLIDAVQRLGIGYHFTTEIENALEQVYVLGGESFIQKCTDKYDLYHAALWFRLLRQQGFRISPDVFNKFQDDDGKFKESLASEDHQGLLSLYDASHVAFHGEDILDAAMAFAIKNLETSNVVPNHESSSSIYNSLCFPVWKCFPRALARHSIDVSSKLEDDHASLDRKIILKFAKLDFNILQKLYREELQQLSLWWASLEVQTKFPYARDRLVECYYWSNGVYFEPKYRLSRIILTKFAYVVTVLDDVYDNFGNYDDFDSRCM